MPSAAHSDVASFHLRFGWAALAVFASLGIALEGLHGFKAAWYLELANETRRLLFTLGHAHGTLLAVLNLVFGAVLAGFVSPAGAKIASRLLLAGTILLPAGFLLGGLFLYGSDPGLGILLVPLGGAAIVGAASVCALSSWRPIAAMEPATMERESAARKGAGERRRKKGRKSKE